ncbi:DUF2000 domain-containing protein [Allonocardiopsis opalescens]|nr:DUF2000 domain-containing protein [Allonocardiopsis opalescens]
MRTAPHPADGVLDARTAARSMPRLARTDVRPDLPTREARLKWVIVVDQELPAGLAANAAVCLGAAAGRALPEVVGPGGPDASGSHHPGLPWTGCAILAADQATVRAIRERAAAKAELHLVAMPALAQESRVYDGYLAALAATPEPELRYYGLSLIGARNKVDKLVGRLPLLR